ncbi:MAG: hypothetical protein ABI175_29855 [Polyangiales bacterium]
MAAIAVYWGFVAWGTAIVLYRVTHAQLRANSAAAWPAAVLASTSLLAAASRFIVEARLPDAEPDFSGMPPAYKWWLLAVVAGLQLVTELVAVRRMARATTPPALDAADAPALEAKKPKPFLDKPKLTGRR